MSRISFLLKDIWDQTERTVELGCDPSESACYLVRIEFSGEGDKPDYDKLHDYLADHGFQKTATTSGVKTFELLSASYLYLNRGKEEIAKVHRQLKTHLLNFRAKEGLTGKVVRFYVTQLMSMSVENLVEEEDE